MILFCCGMARSGSTVQYQIASDLVESRSLGMAIGWIGSPTRTTIDVIRDAARRKDKLLVVKCHDFMPDVVELVKQGNAKALYIYRDIRDVLVSLSLKFYDSTEAAINAGALNTQLKNYYGWSHLDGLFISRYETAVFKLEEEVRRIAEYIGIETTQKEEKLIATKFSIKNQKKRLEAFDYIKQGAKTHIDADAYDPETQLHNNHIQSGRSGQWKTALSSTQIRLVEDNTFSWLVDRDYLLSSATDEAATEEADAHSQFKILPDASQITDLENLQRYILADANNPDLHYQMGNVHSHKKNYLAAENAYRHAVSLAPSSRAYMVAMRKAVRARL